MKIKAAPSNLKHIVLYGVVTAILVFSLKWLQWKFLIIENAIDIYIGLIAIFFTCLGAWVAMQIDRPNVQAIVRENTIDVEQPKQFLVDEVALKKLELTNREYQMLQLIAEGNSNADIAKILFLSLSTVKTHISNLYTKMEVNSRTQAIAKAQKLKIIPSPH